MLCNSKGDKADAVAMKELMHKLDPLGNRPVSANQNGWEGEGTPLDLQVRPFSNSCWLLMACRQPHWRAWPMHTCVLRTAATAGMIAAGCEPCPMTYSCVDRPAAQGFDYSTQNYDSWHDKAPEIPSMSSETSSAVSDRGEYKNNATTGHVKFLHRFAVLLVHDLLVLFLPCPCLSDGVSP